MHIKYRVNLLLYVKAYKKMFLRHKNPTAKKSYQLNSFLIINGEITH